MYIITKPMTITETIKALNSQFVGLILEGKYEIERAGDKSMKIKLCDKQAGRLSCSYTFTIYFAYSELLDKYTVLTLDSGTFMPLEFAENEKHSIFKLLTVDHARVKREQLIDKIAQEQANLDELVEQMKGLPNG